MFGRHLLESARLEDGALVLAVQLNWYRSVPLSCVERLEIDLDGVLLDTGRATLELCGTPVPVDGLTTQDDRWWPVLESATVRVDLQTAPPAGPHGVGLLIGTRIPYLVSPSGEAAVIVDRARAVVAR